MHIGYGDEAFLEGVEIRGFDKNSLKEIGFEEGLKDNEVILVNNKAYYDEKGKLNNIDITNLKEGDTFKLPVSNFNYGSEEDYKKKVPKEKEKDPPEELNYMTEFEYKKLDENTYLIDGSISLYELKKILNVELPEGDYETLSGYLIEKLGRLPEEGEYPVIEDEKLTYKIQEYEDKRIRWVKVCKNKQEINENKEN